MEQEVRTKEKAAKEKDKAKKQVLLRLAPSLWSDLASWAEEDYRSINSQIEYLLAECVRKHKGKIRAEMAFGYAVHGVDLVIYHIS